MRFVEAVAATLREEQLHGCHGERKSALEDERLLGFRWLWTLRFMRLTQTVASEVINMTIGNLSI